MALRWYWGLRAPVGQNSFCEKMAIPLSWQCVAVESLTKGAIIISDLPLVAMEALQRGNK